MLPRQPLRFLLADDPGAGKTIMAGLLIKELIARGGLERCLVVCPGSLAEQWQDELYRRFRLPFEILTRDKLEAARTGNWFLETPLVVARLDMLSRNEDLQARLEAPDCGWDLVVCEEAHKLSATFFGGEVNYTKRYRLGQLLSSLSRHFLLMTATPHNGKEEDFQLFMALLDGDRFEGGGRDGVHTADVSDLMRRMVKEHLLTFEGKPLFPERIAYTVPFRPDVAFLDPAAGRTRLLARGAPGSGMVSGLPKMAVVSLLFPVLRCKLQRSKERESLWNRRAGDLSVLDTRTDFLHEIADEDHPTPSDTFSRLAAAVNEQRDLIDVLGNRHTRKQPRDVLAARIEFLRVPSLSHWPDVRVKGRFDLHQRALFGVEPDNVKLALVAAVRSLANLHVPADEVPAELVPFGDQRFKVIPCHV